MSHPDRFTGEVEVINNARPYVGTEHIIKLPPISVSLPKTAGLPKAERTVPHYRRYQLRELGRVAPRQKEGVIPNLQSITSRAQIGRKL